MMSEWISVEKNLPESGVMVLVHSSWGVRTASRHEPTWASGCFQDYATSSDEGMFDWDDGKGVFTVYHWMKLPEPPTNKEKHAGNDPQGR